MKLILFFLLMLLSFNLNAQTKEQKWKVYVQDFQNALSKKDKSKMVSLVGNPIQSEGISNSEWVKRILSDRNNISKLNKTLSTKPTSGIGHDKMLCYQSLCLYFDYKNNKWLLVDAFED